MAIVQTLAVDQIEITAQNIVQVREINQFVDDSTNPSTVTNAGYQRHVIVPGQDYSKEDAKVKAICAAVHTPEVIVEYQAQQLANQPVGA